jgi:hypothetical protein
VTAQFLASASRHQAGVRVVRVTAKECTNLNLYPKPSPDPDQPPGHLVIPEMLYLKDNAKNKLQRQIIKDRAQQLAQIASKNVVYVPAGMPEPS